MSVLLTLICPIYKVGVYLPDLIGSLIDGANSPKVRVIFVNDCSPDDSMDVCRAHLTERASEILFKYDLIERRSNGGVSAARNTGLERVASPYLGFIDSDDLISANYYSVLEADLNGRRWDIIEFGLMEFRDAIPNSIDDGRKSEVDQLSPFYSGFFSWTRVYRTEMVQDLSFPLNKIYEDIHYVLRAFGLAQRILRIETPLVFYRKRDGSITDRRRRDHRYADQLVNLASGLEASWPGQRQRRQVLRLAAKKSLLIILKGLRIGNADERHRFMRACDEPIGILLSLASKEPGALISSWLMHSCSLLIRLATRPRLGL